jgi:hypothetical protein
MDSSRGAASDRPYRLELSLQGFRTYAQTSLVLQVNANPVINAALGPGSLEETVSVEAAAPLVDVRSAGISEVVEQERIVALPLQGRQVTDLIVLAGGAVNEGTLSALSNSGSVAISVDQRPEHDRVEGRAPQRAIDPARFARPAPFKPR